MEAERTKLSSEKMEEIEIASVVEDAKRRCAALSDRLQRLPKSKLSPAPKATLLRLIHSELNFLHRLSATSHSSTPLSFNIGHLEAVVHVLLQPFVTGVSRVCKPINLSPSNSIYVDIVCSLNGNPVWFVVSDRNPRYISWDDGSCDKNKRLKKKIEQVVDAARTSPVTLRPSSIVLFFSNGLEDNVYQQLRCEFGAVDLEMEPFSYEELNLDDEWTNVMLGRSFPDACVVRIEVDKDGNAMERSVTESESESMGGLVSCNKHDKESDLNLGTSLSNLVSVMKCWCCSLDDNIELEVGLLKPSCRDAESNLVNFDTTAMVAIVSGISNGQTEKLLATPESELRGRFKGNYDFVIAQVDSEIQNPMHNELFRVVSGKRGIICESVRLEFQELISMCGGLNEKQRAEYFLKFLKIVPDYPSTRLISLPTTRKLALKNKVVFGTGDYWNAPTVTANMAFVRAVSQTGMSLSVIEHRPRALIGD
ncbi:hypothetical protein CDL12_18043 [Handroanthus impetiginosus]|uniref:DUF1308 domain-containing protein n=1 Tax=Handroanthus impetiginosus TaxID=429701 RepID=A0A2G9GVX8_9LAMI|nr:hypothetical protein CDL12_18043 [Handroanthus impetiginosus]